MITDSEKVSEIDGEVTSMYLLKVKNANTTHVEGAKRQYLQIEKELQRNVEFLSHF